MKSSVLHEHLYLGGAPTYPIVDPIVDPVLQTMGRKAKPCAALVSSVISPNMVFKTPTLNRPAKERLATGAGKDRDDQNRASRA